jgi:hypothetical protein
MFKSFALLVVFASASALAQGVTPFCSLQCANGGECKRTGERTNISKGADAKKANNRLPDDSHCTCPTGYTGVLCEIKYTMCEGDVKTCFNGEDCIRNIDDRGKSFYHCQCDAVESDLSTPEAHQFWYVLYYCIVSYPHRVILYIASMFLQSLFTQNSLLSPCSYVLQFSGFNACSSDPVNIYSLLSAPTSRQTSISIVHFVRILVCAKTRKEKANTTRDATVRKDGLDTTAKSQRMRLLNSKSEGIIILLSWCLLFFFIACMAGIVGLCVQHGFHNSKRSFGRGRRGRGYPAEQDFNVGSIEFTRAPVEDNDDDESL